MAGRPDLTSRTNAALQAPHGSGFCHCVELEFGTLVAQKPDTDSGANIGDTSVSWTGRNITDLLVFTSVDDGDSWQPVQTNGDPIRYQGVSVGLQTPPAVAIPIGWVTTGRTLQVRALFPQAAFGAVLDSVTVHVGYQDGSSFDVTESGATLADPTQCRVILATVFGGGLIAIPDSFLRFYGNGGGAINTSTQLHDGNGNKIRMHLSHGDAITDSPNALTEHGGTVEIQAQSSDTVAGPFLRTRPSVTVTVPGGVCTLSATGIGNGLIPGQSFHIFGFVNAQNNGYFNVLGLAADSLTITQTTMVAEGPITVTMDANRVVGGPGGDRFSKAAMGFEGWIYPENSTGVVLGWMSLDTNGNFVANTILRLDETVAGKSAAIHFLTIESTLPGGVASYDMRSAPGTIIVGAWTHIAFAYDGFFATLYVNGAVVANRPLRSAFNGAGSKTNHTFIPFGIVIPTQGPFVMGRHPRDGSESYTGRMSEWRFYGAALTVGLIQQRIRRRLVTAELPAMVSNSLFNGDSLQAYHPMTDGMGITAVDATATVVGHVGSADLSFDQIQPAHSAAVPFQLGWVADAYGVWQGFEVDWPPSATSLRAAGRQSQAFSIDPPGDILRLSDSPFTVSFADGRDFIGAAGAGQIEAVQEAGDLTPTGVKMTLSGVLPQHLSLALNVQYLDRPCRVYQFMWDGDGTPLDPFRIFKGKMDVMAVSLGQTAAVQLSAESDLTNWRRPRNLHWNDLSHRSIWPDDNGFEFVAQMVDLDVWWPVRLVTSNTPSAPGGS